MTTPIPLGVSNVALPSTANSGSVNLPNYTGGSTQIPAGANAALIGGTYYSNTGGTYSTIAGSAFAVPTNEGGIRQGDQAGVAMSFFGRAVKVVPTGGTETIQVVRSAAYDEGPTCQIAWFTVDDPDDFVRAFSNDTGSNKNMAVTLATLPSDLVVVFAGKDGGGSLEVPAGTTQMGTLQGPQNSGYQLVAQRAAAGSPATTTTVTAGYAAFPTFFGFSLKEGTAPPTGQTAYPDADITDGAWTPSTGSDLYAAIDETPPSDTDYISVDSNSECEIGLGDLFEPISGDQTFRYTALGSAAKALVAGIYNGATLIEEWTVDPLPQASTRYNRVLTTPMTDVSNVRIRFKTQDAAAPPTLAVTYGAIGTAANATSTTTTTAAYPAGTPAPLTTKYYLVVWGRSNTEATEPAVTGGGWTKVDTALGGVGAWAADTGTRRVTIFRKDSVTGTESGSVTVTLGGTTANTLYARIVRVEVPSGYSINEQFLFGADTSHGTSWSATGGTGTFATGSLVLVATAQSTDTATQSSQALAATGITFGSRTQASNTAVTGGNDQRAMLDVLPVTTGSGSAVAPTWTHTNSANASGVTVFLILTAVPPTVAARVTQAQFDIPEAADIDAPSFTLQPTDETVAEGGTATFTATTVDATTFQWQMRPNSGGSWSNVSVGTGGTTEEYSLSGVTIDMDGQQFRLGATGPGGTTYSDIVTLTVTTLKLKYRGIIGGGAGSPVSNVNVLAPLMVDGDLDLLIIGAGVISGPAPFIDTPAGWTWIGNSDSLPLAGGILPTRVYVFARDATGAGSTVNVQTTGSVAGLWGYNRASYDNKHGTIRFGPVSFGYHSSAASFVQPDLTTEMTNALRIDWLSQGVAQEAAAPLGMTIRYNDDSGADGLTWAEEQIAAIGATGTRTFTPETTTDAVRVALILYSLASESGDAQLSHIKVGGEWLTGILRAKVAGSWRTGIMKRKVAGNWTA